MSVCLSLYLSNVYMSVCSYVVVGLPVCLSICLSVWLPVHPLYHSEICFHFPLCLTTIPSVFLWKLEQQCIIYLSVSVCPSLSLCLHVSVCPCVCQCVCLSVCLSVSQFVVQWVNLNLKIKRVSPSVYLSVCLPVGWSVYVCWSIYVCLSIRRSLCLSLSFWVIPNFCKVETSP